MKSRILYQLRLWAYHYGRFVLHFVSAIRRIASVLRLIAFVASLLCLTAMVMYVGFEHTPRTLARLMYCLRAVQAVFIVNILYNFLLNYRQTVYQARILKWVVDIGVLLTMLPWIYPRPEHPWIGWLDTVMYSRYFLCGTLGAYALVDVCFGLMNLTGRRTNPSLLLASSFIFFIFVGSLVLMMPRCTYHGIDYADSLFVSTSAVCITGLTSVDISQTFTPFGLLIIGLLVQVGGLGVLTFTSFFALFFSGTNSIYSQLMVKDMIYSKSINSLLPTLLYILGFTLTVEAIGAVAVYLSIPDGMMELDDKLRFAAFHSLSSFCNAGFSCVSEGMSNAAFMRSNQLIYMTTSALILAGAIGFPILVNLKEKLTDTTRRVWCWLRGHRQGDRTIHLYSLNTKLVIYTYMAILVVSSVLFFLFEYNNTLRGMSLYDKVVQSVFNSLTPRSAGFASVDPAAFLPATLLIVVVQMWIGGGSQSMAGGIKVNTFATIWLSLRSIIRGQKAPVAYGRRIASDSIRRANSIVVLSIFSVAVFTLILLLLEPQLSIKSATFEVVSAVFTVGTSLGATAQIGICAKLLLCVAMFLGRVGIISILVGFAGNRADTSQYYPKENIIIN